MTLAVRADYPLHNYSVDKKIALLFGRWCQLWLRCRQSQMVEYGLDRLGLGDHRQHAATSTTVLALEDVEVKDPPQKVSPGSSASKSP